MRSHATLLAKVCLRSRFYRQTLTMTTKPEVTQITADPELNVGCAIVISATGTTVAVSLSLSSLEFSLCWDCRFLCRVTAALAAPLLRFCTTVKRWSIQIRVSSTLRRTCLAASSKNSSVTGPTSCPSFCFRRTEGGLVMFFKASVSLLLDSFCA